MDFLEMRLKDLMGDVKVKDIMNTKLIPPDYSMTIVDTLKNQFVQIDYSTLPVTSGNKLMDLITLSNIKKIPRSQWYTTKASEVMNKISKNNSLKSEDQAIVALSKMIKARLDLLPVVEDKKFIGIVTQDDILKLIEHMKETDSPY